MMTAGLDTHELIKELKASGFTDDQAEAVTRAAMRGREIDFSDLAAKADLNELRTELANARRDVRTEIADIRTEIANVRTEMANLKADPIKWVVGIAFAQSAMFFALLRLFPGAHS